MTDRIINAVLTQEEADVLGDALFYAMRGCDLPEDIELYNRISLKLLPATIVQTVLCPVCENECVQAELDQWSMCHDCDNQMCPNCGSAECGHEEC